MSNFSIATNATYGVMGCSGFWDCSYFATLTVVSAVTLFMFLQAFRTIQNAKSQVLDRIDFILFILSLIQAILVFMMKVAYESNFWTYTLRTLALVQNIVVCSICSYNYYNEEDSSKIQKLKLIGIGVSISLWFFSWIDDRSILLLPVCQRVNNLLFSTLNLAVSLIVLWITYKSSKTINQWVQEEYVKGEGTEIEMKYAEMQRIKAQLLILMISMLSSSLLQFIWDFHKWEYGYSKEICYKLYHPEGLSSFFLLIVHDTVCMLVPPWAIYYIFYWRNRTAFLTGSAGNR